MALQVINLRGEIGTNYNDEARAKKSPYLMMRKGFESKYTRHFCHFNEHENIPLVLEIKESLPCEKWYFVAAKCGMEKREGKVISVVQRGKKKSRAFLITLETFF